MNRDNRIISEDLNDELQRVFPDAQRRERWLTAPHPDLEDAPPEELLRGGREEELLLLLRQEEAGGLAPRDPVDEDAR